MRGSAYVKLKIWLVNRDSTINKRSIDIEYGHSSVGEMNNTYEREDSFNRAKNQAIKQYRNAHSLGSDTELNYRLLASGIINTEKGVRKYYKNRISPQRKRELHKQSFLGKDKPLKKSDIEREITESEYEGETVKQIETNKYIVDTGFIKKKVKVKRKNIKGYWGMNRPASQELKIEVIPPKDTIYIDKSLKGRKKRQVIAHEVYEQEKMKKGMKYRKAHKKALKFERKVK